MERDTRLAVIITGLVWISVFTSVVLEQRLNGAWWGLKASLGITGAVWVIWGGVRWFKR